MKRVLKLFIAFCVFVLGLYVNVVTVEASPKITGNKTFTITQGKAYTIQGKVTSKYNLEYVNAYILTLDQKQALYSGFSGKLKSRKIKSYSLPNSKVDCGLKFNLLKPGTYFYKVTAKDTAGKAVCLVLQKFTVKGVPSTLKISGTYTGSKAFSITQGKALTIQGKVTSNYNLEYVNAYILGSDQKQVLYDGYSHSLTSKKMKSYTLANSPLDTALKFNLLKPGTYYYKVTAKDASGKAMTLVLQKFSVKEKTVTTNTSFDFMWPTSGTTVTSKFGYRLNKTDYHLGIDVSGKKGNPIYAAYNGKVVEIGNMGSTGYGKYLILQHNINGKKYYTLYAHCSSILVYNGKNVTRGDLIAKVGNTGHVIRGKKSDGSHLHFEVKTKQHIDYVRYNKGQGKLKSPSVIVQEQGVQNPLNFSYIKKNGSRFIPK